MRSILLSNSTKFECGNKHEFWKVKEDHFAPIHQARESVSNK